MLREITASDRKEIIGYISASELPVGGRETSGARFLSVLGKEKSMYIVALKLCPTQGHTGVTSDHPPSR